MKTILITGASRGIGLELVRQLATSSQCEIIATCRDPESSEELNDIAKTYPDKVKVLPLDVESETSIESLAKQLEGDSIDLLYNNAGILDWRTIEELEAPVMERIYKVNVVGAMLVLRSFLPHLRRANAPLVVNVSSRLGSISLRGNTQLGGAIGYSASKAALNMLTKQASIDLAADGITVVSISPGWVRTDMGGPDAKYSVEESVEKIIRNTEGFEPKDSGGFFGEDGETIPY